MGGGGNTGGGLAGLFGGASGGGSGNPLDALGTVPSLTGNRDAASTLGSLGSLVNIKNGATGGGDQCCANSGGTSCGKFIVDCCQAGVRCEKRIFSQHCAGPKIQGCW